MRSAIIGIAIFLIALGLYAIIYDQISYTKREKLIDIGPLQATVATEAHCVRLPVIFGALVIVSGAALIVMHFSKKKD